jgi:hypothetical protein
MVRRPRGGAGRDTISSPLRTSEKACSGGFMPPSGVEALKVMGGDRLNRGEIRWYTFRPPDKRRPVLILTRSDVIYQLGGSERLRCT